MRRVFWLSVSFLALSAAELTLGAPTRLVVHGDGARVVWLLTLPAGEHHCPLPWGTSGAVQVQGCAWRCTDTDATVPAAPPAGAEDLVQARNRWWAATSAHRAQVRVQEQVIARLTSAAPAAGAPLAPAIDAACTGQEMLTATAAVLLSERRRLEHEAARLGAGNPTWLALNVFAPRDAALAMRDLAGAITTPQRVRQVTLSSSEACAIAISIDLDAVTWTPAAELQLGPNTASLIRQAVLTKPMNLDLGAIAVVAVAEPRTATLQLPEVPGLRLNAETADLERRSVSESLTTGSYRSAPSPSATSEAISTLSQQPSAPADVTPIVAPPTVLIAQPGMAVVWDLGVVDLARGSSRVVVERPSAALAVVADEWCLVPALERVAVRRVRARLDAQPLLAGPLTVVNDGRPCGTTYWPAVPAGGEVQVRADEDATVFTAPAIPWAVPADQQTAKRQRHGSSVAVRNRSDQPRTIAYYSTIPVAASAEITVTTDAATTPGATVVAPGVLRWQLEIPAASSLEVSAGYIVTSTLALDL